MATLLSEVKRECTMAGSSGQRTLALFPRCVDHMAEHGDWTPLAFLIGRMEPAQARILKALAGKVLQGYVMKTDTDQPSGLKIAPQRSKNQGFDEDFMRKVRALVDAKKSIQSKDVMALIKKPAPTHVPWDAEAAAAAAEKALERLAEKYDVPYAQIVSLVLSPAQVAALTASSAA